MNYVTHQAPETLTIFLIGKVSYSDHLQFREISRACEGSSAPGVVFDMTEVDFIDSTGLGMLIVAGEEAKKQQKEFIIKNPNSQVKKLFYTTKTNQFFTIRP